MRNSNLKTMNAIKCVAVLSLILVAAEGQKCESWEIPFGCIQVCGHVLVKTTFTLLKPQKGSSIKTFKEVVTLNKLMK